MDVKVNCLSEACCVGRPTHVSACVDQRTSARVDRHTSARVVQSDAVAFIFVDKKTTAVDLHKAGPVCFCFLFFFVETDHIA